MNLRRVDHPVEGDDPLKVITEIREDDPPSPRQIRRELSRDLDVVVMKAMAKDPVDRYQTAQEFADDLRAVQEGRTVRARGLSTWEKAARWSRKNQQSVRMISTAVGLTLAAIFCAVIAWSGYRDSQRGEFLLRASGGPFTGRFFSVDAQNRRTFKTAMTVPMQNAQKLEEGDYDVQLAPMGRWSSIVRMPIQRGTYQDFRLRRDREQRREVSMEETTALPVAGFSEPAIVQIKGSTLSRKTLDESNDWTMDVSAVEVAVTGISPVDVASDAETSQETDRPAMRTVDFGFDSSRNQDWAHDRLYANTTEANPTRVLRKPIDLDGDGRSETILAADNSSALMAINAEGKTLWARGFEFETPQQNPAPNRRLVLPGIVSIVNVGDVNQDSVEDLIVSLVRVQPTVQTDAALAWISGRDGTTIRVLRMPSINGTQPQWPLDGCLRYMTPRQRVESNIAFAVDGVSQESFSRSKEIRFSWTTSSSRTSGFPLPSPLQLTDDAKTLVYLAGQSCHQIDVKTGTPSNPVFQLPSMPRNTPRLVRGGNETLLVFAGVYANPQNVSPGYPLVAYDSQGAEKWRKSLNDELGRANFAYRGTDWPLIVDLNGDGEDELIVSLEEPRRRQVTGLTAIRADGSKLWDETSEAIRATGERFMRLVSTSDINDDGWRDLAVASIAGPPAFQASNSTFRHVSGTTDSRKREVYVYLDWLSGRDGARLSWARHPVPWFSDRIQVCEIDALRSREQVSPGEVELDIVAGDTSKDSEMFAMTLRFRQDQPQAIAIANGLSLCDAQPTRTRNTTRVFHQRPGPFRDGAEKLVFLKEQPDGDLRLGLSSPLVRWDHDGSSFLALEDNSHETLQVLDQTSGRTLWTIQQQKSRPIKRRDGSFDLLIQNRRSQPPKLVDGETGQTLWSASSPDHGLLIDAQTVSDSQTECILWFDNGVASLNAGPPKETLSMRYAEIATGRVRWTRRLEQQATSNLQFEGLRDYAFAELSGDTDLDLVGFEPDKNGRWQMVGLNGVSGKELWRVPMNLADREEIRWPPIRILQTEFGPRVFTIRQSPENKSEVEAILCEGTSGEIVSRVALPELKGWTWQGTYGWPDNTIEVVQHSDETSNGRSDSLSRCIDVSLSVECN